MLSIKYTYSASHEEKSAVEYLLSIEKIFSRLSFEGGQLNTLPFLTSIYIKVKVNQCFFFEECFKRMVKCDSAMSSLSNQNNNATNLQRC